MNDVDLRKLFTERADNLPKNADLDISAMEAVRQCLPAIHRAKKKKMSWETIAKIVRDIVQESLGVELRLTGNTVRYYYYQFTRKRKRSDLTAVPPKPRSHSTLRTSEKSGSATDSAPLPPPTQTPARSPDPKPELGPEVIPVVDELTPAETEQAEPTEELHPNRFRGRFKKVTNPKTTTGYENCKSL